MSVTAADLQKEIDSLQLDNPTLRPDDLFVLWFLQAQIVSRKEEAIDAITGANDGGIDAILVSDKAKLITIVQGKFRDLSKKPSREKRADVMSFAGLAEQLRSDGWQNLIPSVNPDLQRRIASATRLLQQRGYRLELWYVTTGSCSQRLANAAIAEVARQTARTASLRVLARGEVLALHADYVDDVAPPVPTVQMEISGEAGVKIDGVHHRFDEATSIESWVCSVRAAVVAEIFDDAGPRIFARNIRGYLGDTAINKGMMETLRKEPHYFWYYNNGITILCTGAERTSAGGREWLRLDNPQIINGQQTTRVLQQNRSDAASVLVKVIQVASTDDSDFDELVARIVRATNWQNAILPSDLRSNDRVHVELEREFRRYGYLYMRKRETKSEARSKPGAKGLRYVIGKHDLARASAACHPRLDPQLVRRGKERLFDEHHGTVFPKSTATYYLPRYWLSREVSGVARGHPQRAYPKWHVVRLVWDELDGELQGRGEEAFRHACETNDGQALGPLRRAIESAFDAALSFHRKEEGTGPTARDVSAFFDRPGLQEAFVSSWVNTRRFERFKKSVARFRESLR